jgi:hypothetical protein
MKMHEVIVPQGFERYPALWNDPHYLSSFSLGVRVIAGSNPATPTTGVGQISLRVPFQHDNSAAEVSGP